MSQSILLHDRVSGFNRSGKRAASGRLPKGVYRVPGKGYCGAVPGTGTRRSNASSMGAASAVGPNGVYGRGTGWVLERPGIAPFGTTP